MHNPELQVDSAFIDSLSTVLFDPECSAGSRFAPNGEPHRHIYVVVLRTGNRYSIQAMPRCYPARYSRGFFEYKGYVYWFFGDFPAKIISKTKTERQFTYTSIPVPTEMLLWRLTYDRKTGKVVGNGNTLIMGYN